MSAAPVFINLTTLIALGISLHSIIKHILNYNEPALQLYIVRILCMVPVSSLNVWDCWLGLCHRNVLLDCQSWTLFGVLDDQRYVRTLSCLTFKVTKLTFCISLCSWWSATWEEILPSITIWIKSTKFTTHNLSGSTWCQFVQIGISSLKLKKAYSSLSWSSQPRQQLRWYLTSTVCTKKATSH